MVLLSFVLQDIYSILILEAQLSRKAQDTNQKQRKQENKKTRKENKIQTKNGKSVIQFTQKFRLFRVLLKSLV